MMDELAPERLRRTCDPAQFEFTTTDEVSALNGILGQPRASAALRFGLDIQDRGYHIFIAGAPGTGKMTAVNSFLAETARARPPAEDTCYVYNFADAEHPRALRLPAGRGRQLARDVEQLVSVVRRELPRAFESDEYTQRRDAVARDLDRERETQLSALNDLARKEGFALQGSPVGLVLIPLLNDKPMTEEDFAALSAPDRADWELRRARVEGEISQVMKTLRAREASARQSVTQLNREVALHHIGGQVQDLLDDYRAFAPVTAYLTALQEDMVSQVDLFRSANEEVATDPLQSSQRERIWRRYRVNVLVDASAQQGAPVVMDPNPTYPNLVGRVEKEAQLGVLITDFTLIRSGSLHRANGGYLVLRAEDVLRQPLAWDGLKRALRDQEIAIEEPTDILGISVAHTLRPEPVPLELKVILVGDPTLFQALYALDPDFRELFRVHSDFAERIPRSKENEDALVGFVCRVCHDEHLLPFERETLARLIEEASRLAEDQDKLSARFGEVSDLLREAHYWATKQNATTVRAEHLQQAVDQKVYRSSMIEEDLREMITRGTILVDTAGKVVGQVNGLAVYTYAGHSFALPGRITASVGIGREGIVDIEREAKLGGRIHSKGVMILSGFLSDRFTQAEPLSVSAHLTFEQSYGEVEGDSASSAELYAILSRLAGAPIDQRLAVTGSVNQKGEVQAIGGVNEKIEGFFAVCKEKGLTGDQGVLIPAANVRNLMLRDDVVEAVRAGTFHIYPIATIDEGIARLTGLPAGERAADGRFPADSINGRVDARLKEMSRVLQVMARAAERGGNGKVRATTPLKEPS